MIKFLTKGEIEVLRKRWPADTRVELVKMENEPRADMVPGSRGNVQFVDDSGGIHIDWDNGSTLAAIAGIDIIKQVEKIESVYYLEKGSDCIFAIKPGNITTLPKYKIGKGFESVSAARAFIETESGKKLNGIKLDGKWYNDTNRICPHCRGVVYRSDNRDEYKFQCFDCDEDFYNFECGVANEKN